MRSFVPKFAKTVPAEAELVFEGKIWEVYQWPQELFDGSRATFEMLRRPDTVKIVAVKGDKIITTKQRQPREDWFYDFPGGRADEPAENELEAAQRELKEETGMTFRKWKLIGVEQPFSKIDWLVYTFLATDFEGQTAQNLDAGEKIEVLELGFDEVQALKNDPHSRYLEISKNVPYASLEELLAAPALFEY